MEQEEQEEPETFLVILQQEWPKPFALFTVEALWEHWGGKKKKKTHPKNGAVIPGFGWSFHMLEA